MPMLPFLDSAPCEAHAWAAGCSFLAFTFSARSVPLQGLACLVARQNPRDAFCLAIVPSIKLHVSCDKRLSMVGNLTFTHAAAFWSAESFSCTAGVNRGWGGSRAMPACSLP